MDDEAGRLAIAALRAHGFAHGSAEEQLRVVQHTMTLRREEDALLARIANERARRDPEATARKLFLNLRAYWFLSVRRMEGVVALNVLLLALALTGLAATARRDAARWLPAAVAVYLWLAYSLIIANSHSRSRCCRWWRSTRARGPCGCGGCGCGPRFRR